MRACLVSCSNLFKPVQSRLGQNYQNQFVVRLWFLLVVAVGLEAYDAEKEGNRQVYTSEKGDILGYAIHRTSLHGIIFSNIIRLNQKTIARYERYV